MYPFGWRDRSLGRRTRDILIILLCALLVLNVVQFVVSRNTGNRTSVLRDTLIVTVRADIASARNAATQLSRIGGSNGQRLLAETQQYLYGVTQLNNLTLTVYGGGQMLVPQKTVDSAISSVETCRTRVLSGQAIDVPLGELIQQITDLETAAAALK